jgi:diaminopimelate epimerase
VSVAIEKWQGAGNAYLIVESAALPFALTPVGAALLCDARSGIGADGVLELSPAADADATMRITNPDGSASEACGNGTRMVMRYLAERGTVASDQEVRIRTEAGLLVGTVEGDRVAVEMTAAELEGPQYRPTAEPFPYAHRFVSIGNPHVVLAVGDPATFPLDVEGPILERHAWFPQRANVEVMRVRDRHHVEVRVWERGVGETWACGTGACAVAVAAVLSGDAESPVEVELPGGTLTIDVDPESLAVTMTGDAERIARIELSDELVARLRAAAA